MPRPDSMINTVNLSSGLLSLWGYFYPQKNITYTQVEYSVIKDYKLIRTFHKFGFRHKYFIGIYRKNKKLYFIKTWDKTKKDFDYFDLLNEYSRGRALAHLISKYHFSGFTTPAPLELIAGGRILSLVYDFVPGRSLHELNKREQAKYLLRVTDGLMELSQHMTASDRKSFPLLGNMQFIINLPIISLIAIARSPGSVLHIISEFIICIKTFRWFDQPLYLAHRDLSPENILISANRLYLIDCSSLVLTFPHYDSLKLTSPPLCQNSHDIFLTHYLNLYLLAFHPPYEKN